MEKIRCVCPETLRPKMLYLHYRLGGDAGAKAVVGKEGWLFYTPDVDYLVGPHYDDRRIIKPAGKSEKADWAPVPAILDFRDQLRERDIDLLMVVVPSKPSIYPERLSGRTPRRPEGLAWQTRKLVDTLSILGVNVVDLNSAFQQERLARDGADPQPLYLIRDTHWTLRGVRTAAKAIAAEVRRLFEFDSGSRISYRLEDTLVVRDGDIVAMTKMWGQERLFAPETTLAQRVLDESGNPYRNQKDSPILFLGDSFSRIYERDRPQSAGVIAHLAHELSLPLKAIINDGGASTLVRTQLARRPGYLEGTRLVIWEFTERDIRFGMEGWRKVSLAGNMDAGE